VAGRVFAQTSHASGGRGGIVPAVITQARRPGAPASALRLAAAITCAVGAVSAASCGGTTGREGLASPGLPEAGGDDTTVDLDSGAFDVSIAYADRALPEASPPVEGGEAARPWPQCPPFIEVGPDGGPVPAGQEVDQVPSAFGGDGGVVPAPDGSACAQYGWLGSTAIDECTTSATAGTGIDYVFLPPCNWSIDAGTARQGPRAGAPRYEVCLDLYGCIMKSSCGAIDVKTCLCGSGPTTSCDAGGPCGQEELAALEYRAGSIQDALKNYTNLDPSFSGYGGAALNQLFQNATSNGCFDAGP
jgi:hypothetical protein